jgi:UDPglucose 6-dehydrogenase|tara:strand:+ start:4753 stop:5937 length:1185 start_codon:yes stop_codon:yes gene_type:complete
MFGLDKKVLWGTKIGFIGLGKLGMPCAEAMVKKGFDVTGYDIVPKTSSYVEIRDSIKDVCSDRDIVFVATPTPHEDGYDGRTPTSHLPVKDFNYDAVKKVLTKCNDNMTEAQTLVLISTVLPGTTRREFAPLVTNTKLMYNPYLIAMGTVADDMVNPEMIMIGSKNGLAGTNCKIRSEMLESFYNQVCDNFPRMEFGTWEEVESMKIFYNTFISNKIALVNMIQDVAHKLGNMDVDVVTQALAKSTKRIVSPAYMKAGMGDGGACHPRDNIALRWLAKELELGYDMFESIMTAREQQAETMAKAILTHGKNVWFSSDSYKPGTDLVDGSSSLLVQHYIKKHGGTLANGIDTPVEVIIRVHESDQFQADESTIIFDPWRTYPKANNVIYYGHPVE